MGYKKTLKWESLISLVIIFATIWLLINFDTNVALIYGFILILDWIILRYDKSVAYRTFKTGDKTKNFISVLLGVGAYYMFLGINITVMIFFGFIKISDISINSMISTYATYFATTFSQLTPLLEGSLIITFVVWGILIPIAETRLFVRFGEFAGENLFGMKAPFNFIKGNHWFDNNKKNLAIIFFVGALFTFFHLSAKTVGGAYEQDIAFLMVFVFGSFTMLLSMIRKQTIEAQVMHIVANTIAISMAIMGIALNLYYIIAIAGGSIYAYYYIHEDLNKILK